VQPDVADAASQGHAVTLKALLDTGMVEVNAVDSHGDCLLTLAQENREPLTTEVLLSAGADPNLQLPGGATPLLKAVEGYNLSEIVAALIKHGAKVNTPDAKGRTPLMAALENEGQPEVVSLLLDNGADPNTKIADGTSVLTFAAKSGKKTLVKDVLDRGADVNLKGKSGIPPLEVAVLAGCRSNEDKYAEVVDLLLAKGADVNPKDPNGYTPLLAAYDANGYVDNTVRIVRMLLEHHSDVNATTSSGETAPIRR
jgi:ankyrin repeat protein